MKNSFVAEHATQRPGQRRPSFGTDGRYVTVLCEIRSEIGGQPASPAASEALVAEMQQQLREGVDTCARVLALQQPLPSEPVILISTGHLKTIDPCCLVRTPQVAFQPSRTRMAAEWARSISA